MEQSGGSGEGDLSSSQCVNFPLKSSLLTHNQIKDDFRGKLTACENTFAAINSTSQSVYQDLETTNVTVDNNHHGQNDQTAAQEYLKKLLLFQQYFQKQQQIQQVLAKADPQIVQGLMNDYYSFKQKQLRKNQHLSQSNKTQSQQQQQQLQTKQISVNEPLKQQQQSQQSQQNLINSTNANSAFLNQKKSFQKVQQKQTFNSPSTVSIQSNNNDQSNAFQLESENKQEIETEEDETDSQTTEEASPQQATAVDANAIEIENNLQDRERKLLQEKLVKLIEKIEIVCEKLNLLQDEIRQMSKSLASQITPFLKQNFRNKPYEAVAMAIILLSSRNVQYPITIRDMMNLNFGTQAKNISQRIIYKCIISIKKIINNNQFIFYNPQQLVEKIAQKINLKTETVECAKGIVQKIDERNLLLGRSAFSVAGSGILMSCILNSENKTFDEVSVAANVNKVTLKNMYREIFPFRFEIINQNEGSINNKLNEEQQRNLYQFYIL